MKLKHRLLSSGSPIVSVSELSSLYHFPYTETTQTEDIITTKSPQLPAPLTLKKANGTLDIIFARNIHGGTITPIGLTTEERRRHMYMIGATGMGKTTLLLQMICKDIINGKGVAVLDPHGDLSERLLGVIPKERIQEVIYFNPYDIENPVGLNLLELREGLSAVEVQREKDLIVSSLVSIYFKLYPSANARPRMEHVLRNTVLTALSVKEPTLLTVYKLLIDKNFRSGIVEKLEDPILKDYWKKEFSGFGSYQKAELIAPITNKLGRFLTTTITRNILTQKKSKLNFEDIMNNKKILICDLSKGKIGEDISSFIGSLLIVKLQLAALNRVHMPQDKRTDFFLYIDEFQNFATMTFAQILSEARKYRLNTILAHQTISQIDDTDLLKVILANVGTVISFRTSNPTDEDFILPLFKPQVKENRILQSTAASYLMPFVSKQLNDPNGIFMGVNAFNNSLVFIDPFTSRNNNINIFGVSGSGKSVTAKILMNRLFMRGTQIIVIDPEGEYMNLARALGGEVISFSQNNGINPFYISSSKQEDINDHVSTLKTFFKFFISPNHYDSSVLDEAIMKLYDQGSPTFENLLMLLKNHPIAKDLRILSTGSLQGVFNSTRKLELDSDMIVLDLHDLKKDEKRDPAMYLLTSLIWNLVNKNNDKKRMLFVDEAHKLLADKDVAIFYRELVKQARKRNVGVVSITQDVEDFLRNEYGKAIITNSETKILLKQSYVTLSDIGTIYPMTDEEKQQLGHLGIGEVVLFRENEHIRLNVSVLPFEQDLVFTIPGQR